MIRAISYAYSPSPKFVEYWEVFKPVNVCGNLPEIRATRSSIPPPSKIVALVENVSEGFRVKDIYFFKVC